MKRKRPLVRARDLAAALALVGFVAGHALASEAPPSSAQLSSALQPIRLHPGNPHYFLWRGKPTVLVTSGEHYGAVVNRDFDYKKYLRTLHTHRFNLTRVFSGAYCEHPGAFRIRGNTLAPREGRFLCPWARSGVSGYAGGGNKFDLAKWDPDYFRRLRDFVAEAGRRGVVVEVVMFCPFYSDALWKLSPLNAENNVNGIGQASRNEVFTLRHRDLLAAGQAMVRKIVTELNEFDNVYFEICNEPHERGGQTEAWQARIAATILEAEKSLPHKHLIAQNLPWRPQNLPRGARTKPMPVEHVSILNFHGAMPPKPVSLYYELSRPIAFDESGGKGIRPDPYRKGGWDFIIAGGAVFDHLDFSFTVGREDGTAEIDAPGGGGPALRRQLEILRDFIGAFDFIRMKPDDSVIQGGVPDGGTVRALAEPARAYALYINGGAQADLIIRLPPGAYRAQWVNTKSGRIDKAETFEHTGGNRTLSSPEYEQDIALRIVRSKEPGQ